MTNQGTATGKAGTDGAEAAAGQRPRIRMQFVADGERTPGIELVEQLLSTGERPSAELSEQVAEQAIEALEHLELPYLVGEFIESGERFAEQVHSQATRGLQEVVQNADDQGARNIRFGYRQRRGRAELLVAHDGNPVEVDDVVRMAWPLLSGSREDPDKIGRFGIGLKTLNQFGDRLQVHCPPLPGFEIRGGRIKRIKSAAALPGFWAPAERETLFVLNLQGDRFALRFFEEWLSAWDASSLLFLRRLQSVRLVDMSDAQTIVERAVDVGRPHSVALDFAGAEQAEQVKIEDVASSRSWTRYSVRYPRPKGIRSTHKPMAETVRLQIAVPQRAETGRLFVGLPLEERCDLPFSLNAPFEPNVDRTLLRDNNKLNEWLIARIGDLATAVSLHRFADRPRTGWRSVALQSEDAGASEWTRSCFAEMVGRQRARVTQKVRLKFPDAAEVRLADLVYERAEFEGLLSIQDVERLWDQTSSQYGPRRAVPKAWRDGQRWREVLASPDTASPLWSSEALQILTWPDDEIAQRGARWLVELVHAGLKAADEDALWDLRCVAIEGETRRMSPAQLAAGGILLVHKLPDEGLAATLELARQIARPFRGGDPSARAVRQWLFEKGVLRENATDADALRALARATREEPIDLRNREPVLQRLRNSFEQLPARERDELGHGIGRNIAVAGFEYETGKKNRRAVRPVDAYLPSAIDKNEGWPSAAGHTPGLLWIDRSYRESLKATRGQGALATLKALGAATAPRLEPGRRPSSDPNATPLVKRRLNAQHRHELAEYPQATGLDDDWISPDLEAVVRDILAEKRSTIRRKRARALFLALDRTWHEQYEDRSTARPVRHYYSWISYGDVSATWVAQLASQPWLSTRQSRFHRASPRDLTVLTAAASEIEGEHPEKYVHEIDAEHVDSPVVEALRIQGRPFASSILDRLDDMRRAEMTGVPIAQAWADRAYQALASYCPGGAYADHSDLSPAQLRKAFAADRAGSGLIRAAGQWLGPDKVRRDPFLDESLPHVRDAEALWDLLGVRPPNTADCVSVFNAHAQRHETNQSAEIRVFRQLIALAGHRRVRKADLARIPLRTYAGWRAPDENAVYAVAAPALAEAVSQKWAVWRPALPLDELSPLLPGLGVEVLDDASFTPEIPSRVAAASGDLGTDFAAAVGHLHDYLAVHHAALDGLLTPTRWQALQRAEVIAGPGWGIRARNRGGRSIRLTVRAYLFDDPLRFCVLHEAEAAALDSGGQAIASYFIGSDPQPEARSTIALAWAHAFDKRDEDRAAIDLGDPDEPEDAPPAGDFGTNKGKNRGRTGRSKSKKRPATPQEAPRELIDLDELDLGDVKAAFLEAKRRGRLKASANTKIKDPKRQPPRPANPTRTQVGQRGFKDRAREDLAYDIVEAILADTRGVNLQDIRDDKNAGADAVDQDKDIWVELKTHGREAADTLRLQPAEAQRAEEKRGRYWLVVVWNLEKPRTPQFVVIPDPLHRLDTYLGRGLKLTGVSDLAAQQPER